MNLYRYELKFEEDGPGGAIVLYEFPVLGKAGIQSVVIRERHGKLKRVRLNAKRPYAHKTKEAALQDLKRRTESRRVYAIGTIDLCDWGLGEIAKMEGRK